MTDNRKVVTSDWPDHAAILPEAFRLSQCVARSAVALPLYEARFIIVDHVVVVRSNSMALLNRVRSVWCLFETTTRAPATHGFHVLDLDPSADDPVLDTLCAQCDDDIRRVAPLRYVLCDETRVLEYRDDPAMLADYLEWYEGRAALSGTTRHAVFHSAALSRGGHGMLLPAASGSGKTTLTSALLLAGCCFLSDEAALVDPHDLTVRTYPKSLSIKQPRLLADLLALPLAAQASMPAADTIWHLDPRLLGAVHCWETTIDTIIFVSRPHSPDHGERTSLTPATTAHAIIQLLKGGMNTLARHESGIAIARRLTSQARCYNLRVTNLNAAVRLVLDTVQAC